MVKSFGTGSIYLCSEAPCSFKLTLSIDCLSPFLLQCLSLKLRSEARVWFKCIQIDHYKNSKSIKMNFSLNLNKFRETKAAPRVKTEKVGNEK